MKKQNLENNMNNLCGLSQFKEFEFTSLKCIIGGTVAPADPPAGGDGPIDPPIQGTGTDRPKPSL